MLNVEAIRRVCNNDYSLQPYDLSTLDLIILCQTQGRQFAATRESHERDINLIRHIDACAEFDMRPIAFETFNEAYDGYEIRWTVQLSDLEVIVDDRDEAFFPGSLDEQAKRIAERAALAGLVGTPRNGWCGHEHDCCGCTNVYRATAKLVDAERRLFEVEQMIYRNV